MKSLFGSALLAAALAAGCGGGTEGPPPVAPPADLETFDPAVQAAYRERRAALDQALERPAATDDEKARAYGALGQWYHAYRRFGGAEAAYGAARALAPEDPRWPYYLAHLARTTGDGEAARALLRRVLELEPGSLAARVWLAESEWEAGDAAAADEAFAAALRQDPRCVRALAGRARAVLARDEAAVAVELYRTALELQPGAAALRYSLGLAYRRLGDLERAAAELARVPADNRDQAPPALEDPWMDEIEALRQGASIDQMRGRRALEAGRYAAAAEHFRRAVESHPESSDARLNLALALSGAGRPAAAEAAAREAVARDPGFVRGRVTLAVLLLRQRRFAEAQQHLEAAVEADPDHETARFNLAQLLRGRGRLEEALAHYARARELDPRMVQASHGHAVTLLWLGRPAAARQALEEDLRRLPENRDLTLLLARLLAAAPEAAARDGRRALELALGAAAGGVTLTAAETVAMALAELGRFADAAAWQEAALAAARVAGRPHLMPLRERRLDLYRRRRPCREPWARGEAPASLPVAPPAGFEVR